MSSEIAFALIPFFFSMATGYFAGKASKGTLPVASINKMLVTYALPFALFVYTSKMQRESLSAHFVLIGVLIAVMIVPYVVSLALSRYVFNVRLANAAVRAVTIGMPNFVAVGLPLLRAVYGEQSDLTVAIAVATAAVVMSPAALILLERAQAASAPGLLGKALRNAMLKPVVLAPVAGVMVAVAGWHLPSLLTQSLGIIGSSTSGLALFSTGLILAAQPFRLDAEVWINVLLSNVIQPLLALALVWLLAMPRDIAGQAILLSAIPCGSFGIVFGLSYDVTDTSSGATLVTSSVLSAVTLAATIVLLGHH